MMDIKAGDRMLSGNTMYPTEVTVVRVWRDAETGRRYVDHARRGGLRMTLEITAFSATHYATEAEMLAR
jgi:hypothetical protein